MHVQIPYDNNSIVNAMFSVKIIQSTVLLYLHIMSIWIYLVM